MFDDTEWIDCKKYANEDNTYIDDDKKLTIDDNADTMITTLTQSMTKVDNEWQRLQVR